MRIIFLPPVRFEHPPVCSSGPFILPWLFCFAILSLGSLSPGPPNPVNPAPQPACPLPRPPRSQVPRDGGPGPQCPTARLYLSTASLSLYPWDKCLIPQGVKGKINHPGEISQLADLAGERQREIGCLRDWLGPPLRVEKCLLCDYKWATVPSATPVPVTSGKSLLMRFWLEKVAVSSPGHSGAALLQVKPQPLRLPSGPASAFSPQQCILPGHSEVKVQSLWHQTSGTLKKHTNNGTNP